MSKNSKSARRDHGFAFQSIRAGHLVSEDFLLLLELLRFFSALLVLIDHLCSSDLFGSVLHFIKPGFGHVGVVVFFVLSGFIIAWRHRVCKETPSEFIANRISRLYSVLIPTLIITILLDITGQQFSSAQYSVAVDNRPLERFGIHFFMLQEYWSLSVRYFSNAPLWTLSFEAIYYLCYWLIFYAKRPFIAAIAMLIAGPKIILLSPLWILGVILLFKWDLACSCWRKYRLQLLITMVISLAVCYATRSPVNTLLGIYLGGASLFFSDYFLGATIAIVFMMVGSSNVRVGGKMTGLLRFLAGFSFELYALHMPIMTFCVAVLFPVSVKSAIATVMSCCIGSWVVSLGSRILKIYLRTRIKNFFTK